MAYWGNSDQLWLSLSGPQRAAAMALLEADARNPVHAKNALGAIINRAEAEGQPLEEHVSRRIYQPTIENSQRARLNSIIQSPEFAQLTELAQARTAGAVPDWVNGADHYLAPPKTMLALEAKEPDKYKDWGPRGSNWTGYDPATGQYGPKVFEDGSHHFLKLYGGRKPLTDAVGLAEPSAAPGPRLPSQQPSEPKSDAVLPFLAALMNSGGATAASGAAGGPAGMLSQMFGGDMGGMGGEEAAAAPPALNGITPLPTAPGGAGGMLSQMFGGGQQPGSNAGADLATQAMTGSANALRGGVPALARQPMDMTRLQQMLASRPMLGMRGGA